MSPPSTAEPHGLSLDDPVGRTALEMERGTDPLARDALHS
jgi:hypothetical protein